MMKRLLLYIPALFFLASCAESEYDGTRNPSLFRRYLSISTSSLSFEAQPSSKHIDIESDQTDWNITIPVGWVSASQTSGNSSATVDFATQLNNSADTSRVCVVTVASNVSDWSRSFDITLTQTKATPYIKLNQSSLTVNGKSQKQTITLNSNVHYTSQSTAEWVSVIEQDSNHIELLIQENTTGNARSGQVTLDANGISTVLSVVQRAANITSTTESLEFTYEAATANIEVESEASWKAVASDWIGLSPSSGTAGKSSLRIDVPKNASAKQRNGYVYLTIDDINRVEIPIIQGGITFTVSTENLEYDSSGGSKSFEISSNSSWQITSCPEWVYLSAKNGEGNTKITATVKENNSTTQLTGKIELSTTDKVITRTINVSQSAKYVDFNVPSLSFTYEKGSKSFAFSTDGNWSVAKDVDWISIDKQTGKGNATIVVSVQENMTLSDRSGTINLTIADQTYKVMVYQECKYLTLSSSAFDFTSATGHTTVAIASNTKWSVSVKNKPNWLVVTPASGDGNAEITIGVSENNTPTERSGVVEVEIPGVHTYIINVTQQGKYVCADKSSIDFSSVGGTIVFNVITDGTYTVSRSGNWFGYSKSGDAISVIASSNDTGANRTGSITLTLANLSLGSYSLTIPVTQSAVSGVKEVESIMKIELK